MPLSCRADVFREDGHLIASFVQDNMIRVTTRPDLAVGRP
jgi:hypothetical protein